MEIVEDLLILLHVLDHPESECLGLRFEPVFQLRHGGGIVAEVVHLGALIRLAHGKPELEGFELVEGTEGLADAG